MNVRKPVDYSSMFAVLDSLMTADLPQMELYCEIGRLVSGKPEKGAAVAASEYLCGAYPDVSGFSPRNLRRMREFCRAYANTPEVLAQAMTIGWTQNVVILEAELALQERLWYIQATGQFGWSKLELTKKIRECAHETMVLDSEADLCYSNGSGGDEVPPFGKSVTAPPERDDVAEKSNPRSPDRSKSYGPYGLRGAIPPFGEKSEEAGTVHPNADVEHRRRGLRSLWRPGVCQGELPDQPNTASYRPHTAGWHAPGNRAAAQNTGKAVDWMALSGSAA